MPTAQVASGDGNGGGGGGNGGGGGGGGLTDRSDVDSVNMVDNSGMMATLPTPSIGALADIAKAIDVLATTSHRYLIELLVADDCLYLQQLFDVFDKLEDLEDEEGLARMTRVVLNLVMVNDVTLFQVLVSDRFFLRFVGSLEFDPLQPRPDVSHRDFLRSCVKLRQAVPVTDPEVVMRIHQTFRFQFIRDVLVAKAMDDPVVATLSHLQTHNHSEIIGRMCLSGASFMQNLATVLHSGVREASDYRAGVVATPAALEAPGSSNVGPAATSDASAAAGAGGSNGTAGLTTGRPGGASGYWDDEVLDDDDAAVAAVQEALRQTAGGGKDKKKKPFSSHAGVVVAQCNGMTPPLAAISDIYKPELSPLDPDAVIASVHGDSSTTSVVSLVSDASSHGSLTAALDAVELSSRPSTAATSGAATGGAGAGTSADAGGSTSGVGSDAGGASASGGGADTVSSTATEAGAGTGSSSGSGLGGGSGGGSGSGSEGGASGSTTGGASKAAGAAADDADDDDDTIGPKLPPDWLMQANTSDDSDMGGNEYRGGSTAAVTAAPAPGSTTPERGRCVQSRIPLSLRFMNFERKLVGAQ